MDLLKNFIAFVQTKNLFTKNDSLLLAVSGGVDSVVLCDLCKQAGFHFEIAHCNFQLRGAESDRDENFVKKMGERYGVEVWVKRFDTLSFAEKNKWGTQEAARKLRYDWFYELANAAAVEKTQSADPKHPAKSFQPQNRHYILTAHHADDNIETVLMNFFKGTGIRGLSGMEAKSGRQNILVRPLLFARRSDVEQYAEENGLSFVTDSSNAEEKYTRNYFRHHLIPDVQKVFSQVEENLLHNIDRFADVEFLYKESVDWYKKKLLHERGNEIHLPVLKLQKIPAAATILHEIVKKYGFKTGQLPDILKLLQGESGKYVASLSHKIIKNRNWLIISPQQQLLAQNIIIEKSDTEIIFEQGELKIKFISDEKYQLLKEQHIAQLDADKITFPLLLRKWRQGDYFYPLGMPKKKKVSRFLMDKKLSISDKEKIWILEMDKKIIWVVGHRIDDRFKLPALTPSILQIKLIPAE